MKRILGYLRGNVLAFVAIGLAIGATGGYAIAATTTNTITVCANKKTGALYLHNRGRCTRNQTRISWNQKGPQGPQGRQGATGPTGASAISVWANVTDAGSMLSGQGLSVHHISAGTYQVTVTAPACAQGFNAPTITVDDSNPPAGQATGAFPTEWVEGGGTNQQFTVITGVVVNGSFTATDHSFNVQDACS